MTQLKLAILDVNSQEVRQPVYLGKIKPGISERAYLYIKNLDHRAEDITLHVTPEWIKILSAPTRLNTEQIGKLIIELSPPYDLDAEHAYMRITGECYTVRVL